MSIAQKHWEVISYVFIMRDGNQSVLGFWIFASDVINVLLDIVFSGQFMLLS